jgi:hypothetical protein
MSNFSGPLDFWESLELNELMAWVFVILGCFVLFLHLLKRAEERRQKRRWRL